MQPGGARVHGLTWRPLGRRLPTIADLTLQVEPGEHVLLVGPSGAGKSTLLLALAGALGTTIAGELEGVVEVGGRLGLMVQNPSDSVVAERIGRDVAFGPENAGLARDQIWRLVDESLAAVGLDYGRDRNVAQLSGGEKQRLALAGSLATRPDVLLLDEPTSMLDEATAGRVRDAVLAAAGERTLIVVEHRFEPWLPHVDRVVVMDAGVIVSNSSVDEFLNGPAFPGIWFPGRPTPLPSPCPGHLVQPEVDVPTVRANDVAVELVAHGLRTRSARTRVLDGFSIEINPEHVVALVGASGSGKSTALAALAGLRKLAAGRVTPEFKRLKPRQFSEIVGWVPQSPELGFVTHRVGDEVEVAARRLGRRIDGRAVLDQFGLASHADAHPSRLSGGEQRRLALASGLAHRPGLLLLDEPTVGQDPQTWAAVTGWLTAARDHGCGVVLATHDPQVAPDLAVHLPDRVGAR